MSSRLIAVSKARGASSYEVAQWSRTTKRATRLACFTWMDVNHCIINSRTNKWIDICFVRSGIKHLPFLLKRTAHSKNKIWIDKNLSLLLVMMSSLVFCPINLVQIGIKSPLEWPNLPKKLLNNRTLRKSISNLVSFPINLPHWQVLPQAFITILTANLYYYPFKKEGKITKQGSQNSHVSYTKIQKWKIFRLLYCLDRE